MTDAEAALVTVILAREHRAATADELPAVLQLVGLKRARLHRDSYGPGRHGIELTPSGIAAYKLYQQGIR